MPSARATGTNRPAVLEPNCCLSVRFRDGLSGRIHLQPEDFTGALAPLRAPEFFSRVFIDQGVVAWPGDIDLAPDAMYRRIAADSNRKRQAT